MYALLRKLVALVTLKPTMPKTQKPYATSLSKGETLPICGMSLTTADLSNTTESNLMDLVESAGPPVECSLGELKRFINICFITKATGLLKARSLITLGDKDAPILVWSGMI